MHETPVIFGSNAALVGVISEPADGASSSERPAIVLLNSGLIHRVGPSRLTVRVARSLARQGWTVLRFDLSGIGDSSASTSTLPATERHVSEIREAMDLLQKECGSKSFVVGGICSGATNTISVARSDERIVGAAIISPPAPDDVFGAYLIARGYWKRKLTSPKAWVRPFTARLDYKRVLDRFTGLFEGKKQAASATNETAEHLAELTARGVDMLFVYTSHGSEIGRRYFKPAIDRASSDESARGRIKEVIVADSNHTFIPVQAQRDLEAVIVQWSERFMAVEKREPVLTS